MGGLDNRQVEVLLVVSLPKTSPGRKRFEVQKNLATQTQVTLAHATPRTMARNELARPRLGNRFLVVLMGVPGGMLSRPSRVLMRAKFVDWPRKHGTQLSPDPISTPLPLGHWNSGWKWMEQWMEMDGVSCYARNSFVNPIHCPRPLDSGCPWTVDALGQWMPLDSGCPWTVDQPNR